MDAAVNGFEDIGDIGKGATNPQDASSNAYAGRQQDGSDDKKGPPLQRALSCC